MIREVEDPYVCREHWRIVSIGNMLASGYKEKPIMGMWSMQRKCNLIGMIVKYKKVCLCAHGGQRTIKGIHYENTYAPVVTWTTI